MASYSSFSQSILLALSIASSIGISFAYASPVCSPQATAAKGYRTFILDPVKGQLSGDGSSARPLPALSVVVDPKNGLIETRSNSQSNKFRDLSTSNIGTLIRAGDTLVLNTGDHGVVDIKGMVNKDYITIQGQPGSIVRRMTIQGTSKLLVYGINFVSDAQDKGRLLVNVGGGMLGPTSNIIFNKNRFLTQADVRSFSAKDWVNKTVDGVKAVGECISVLNNTFVNLRNGIEVGGRFVEISENTFDRFGVDAIQHHASDIVIRRNVIRNSYHVPEEPLHPDGIQGWSDPGLTNRNVVISENTILRDNLNPKIQMQGITIFDGQWDNIAITNNVVITNTYHGITLFGVERAVVSNNTVISSNPALSSWVQVQPSTTGRQSKGISVFNNIVPMLTVSADNVKVEKNLAQKMRVKDSTGRNMFKFSGTYEGNLLDMNLEKTLLNINHATGIYDVRLTAASKAVASGTKVGLPGLDIIKTKRINPDIGAFAFR